MSINCPNISDTSRLTLAQIRKVLDIKDNRTIKKYAAVLGLKMYVRKADGMAVMYGKDVKKIWLRLA